MSYSRGRSDSFGEDERMELREQQKLLDYLNRIEKGRVRCFKRDIAWTCGCRNCMMRRNCKVNALDLHTWVGVPLIVDHRQEHGSFLFAARSLRSVKPSRASTQSAPRLSYNYVWLPRRNICIKIINRYHVCTYIYIYIYILNNCLAAQEQLLMTDSLDSKGRGGAGRAGGRLVRGGGQGVEGLTEGERRRAPPEHARIPLFATPPCRESLPRAR